jgi:hypothetical protein
MGSKTFLATLFEALQQRRIFRCCTTMQPLVGTMDEKSEFESKQLRQYDGALSRHGFQDFAYFSRKLLRPEGLFNEIRPGTQNAKIDDSVLRVS